MTKITIILIVLFSCMHIASFALKISDAYGMYQNLGCEDESTKNEKSSGLDYDLDFTENYLHLYNNPDLKISAVSILPQVPYHGYKDPPPDF